jgi:hypothetical protein
MMMMMMWSSTTYVWKQPKWQHGLGWPVRRLGIRRLPVHHMLHTLHIVVENAVMVLRAVARVQDLS